VFGLKNVVLLGVNGLFLILVYLNCHQSIMLNKNLNQYIKQFCILDNLVTPDNLSVDTGTTTVFFYKTKFHSSHCTEREPKTF